MDPISAAQTGVTAAGHVPRMVRAIRRAAGVDEFAELMRHVVYEVRRDAELPAELRVTVADRLELLRVDPDVNAALRTLIAESDAGALDQFQRRLLDVFDEDTGEIAPAQVAARVTYWIEQSLPRVMRSDRDATVGATRLIGDRIRRDVSEGFDSVTGRLDRQGETLNEIHKVLQDAREPSMPPAVDWAPSWPQKALRALADVTPRAVAQLRDLVEGERGRDRLLAAVADPPAWLADGTRELWEAVARYAEHFGEWRAASAVWERLALAESDGEAALHWLRAAVDARAAGDSDAHRLLLSRADEADPDNPRVKLELADLLPMSEQRAAVAAIVPDNDETAALRNCHLALHVMLAKDLPEAERLAEEAARLAPDLIQVRTLRANVAIERNRLAISMNDPLEVQLATDARRACLDLRAELLPMRRWEETSRLLMLAADSHTVAGEFDEAEQLLLTAVPEEREGERGEVLADAALRAMRWMTAGVFLADDNRSLNARRIRARAKGAYGTAENRAEAASELDAVLAEAIDPDERQATALSRLVLCIRDSSLPWSEPAEQAAIELGETPSALGLKALWLADNGQPDAAITVITPHLPDAWAVEARYHVAITASAADEPEWAAEVLATNPDQHLRLQCAVSLESADPRRARAELTTVARDRHAQKWVRVEAYGRLVLLLLNNDDVSAALRAIDEWQVLSPGDDKASALRVTASARLTRSQET